jgi:glycolate oxidase FAD binding subunit
MATATSSRASLAPSTSAEVADSIRSAYESSRAVYPLGGRTALGYGAESMPAASALDLTGLNRIVDYTPRDMTILVEGGVRMTDVAATLAAEGQQVPIDVPRASDATIGGVVATNWSGPRRYGHGTIRDYAIGIHAVDGRGVAFKGGGRVVKNVAGYDFCKLLCGSHGTLAVITQLALKVKPLPEASATLLVDCTDLSSADKALERLAELESLPASIDLLVGSGWGLQSEIDHRAAIAVRLEGSEPDVAWQSQRIQNDFAANRLAAVRVRTGDAAASLWAMQVEFADRGPGDTPDGSPLVLKIAVRPSGVTAMMRELLNCDAECRIQAHAGNGIIYARFREVRPADLTRVLIGKLRPLAVQQGGSAVVLSSTMEGLTPHMIWGGRTEATVLLERIKQKFDPNGILNPGRFVF